MLSIFNYENNYSIICKVVDSLVTRCVQSLVYVLRLFIILLSKNKVNDVI